MDAKPLGQGSRGTLAGVQGPRLWRIIRRPRGPSTAPPPPMSCETSASACLAQPSTMADDLETYIIHLYTPINHRRAICTTNFLERLLRVERRRMKTSPNGWREKLVSAIMPSDMARAPRCRRSVRVTSIEGCRMHNIGQELDIKYVEDCLSSQAQNQAERPSTLSSRNPN